MIKSTLEDFKNLVFKIAVIKKIMTMVGEQNYISTGINGDSEMGLSGTP